MLGKFITFEGIDGSGKTTIIKFIGEYLLKQGYEVVVTREPGGTKISEKIRSIILFEDIDAKTEALLFAASRRQHIKDKLLPELTAGKIILCDRFLDSSIAYQAYGRGLSKEDILVINNFAIDNLSPDATFYFDVDVEEALSRASNRSDNNNLDNEKKDFYINVKKGYDKLALQQEKRIIRVNANKSIEEVKFEVINKVKELLNRWNIQ
ncbi:dTMP kinase [Gemella sp. zg-1178]|uniref:dTMP kinase n=1 Tax=Gemella sp. zg-1178 TaxID=2840372 RepID=UPI001C04BDA5|nr:dTMP kinase [Gemella sp. zg-1178]MBU0278558.1 dTMP kinase [Gemella sp. zg-1178]